MDFSSFSKVENGCIKAEVIAPEANAYTQYAWYLYEKSLGLVEKRWYGKENVCSFQPAESGNYRVKAFVRYKKREEDEYEKTSQYTNWTVFYATKEIQYENLEQEDFRPAKATIYRIMWNEVPFEFLINYKPQSSCATVFGTGAILGTGKTLPIFSRATWMDELSCTGIWYFDPTLYDRDGIALAWGYGSKERWYLKEISEILRVILSKLEIGPENACFFGSSGGGTTSIMLATMLHGKATAINPQLDVFKYIKYRPSWPFEGRLLKEDGCIVKERLDVFGLFKTERYLPQIHLIVNLESLGDVSQQLLPFVGRLQEENFSFKGMLRVDLYSAEGGHNAMPTKEETLAAIEEDIKREPTDGYFVLFGVEAWIEGNQLRAKVNLQQESSGLDFAYYLYRGDKEVVAKLLPYTKSTQCMFQLPDSGVYHVRAFVRSNAGSPNMFIRAKDSNEVSYETEKE